MMTDRELMQPIIKNYLGKDNMSDELLTQTLKALGREIDALKAQTEQWKSLCEHLIKKLQEKSHV